MAERSFNFSDDEKPFRDLFNFLKETEKMVATITTEKEYFQKEMTSIMTTDKVIFEAIMAKHGLSEIPALASPEESVSFTEYIEEFKKVQNCIKAYFLKESSTEEHYPIRSKTSKKPSEECNLCKDSTDH